MKSNFIFLVTCMALIFSCQSSKKESKETTEKVSIKALKGAVIDVHDEVMPKMGELMSLKKQIMDKIATLENDENNQEQINQLEEAANDLENSHEQMMQWMREFDADMDDMMQQEIVDYLEKEKAKIKKVGELTNASIANARELLGVE